MRLPLPVALLAVLATAAPLVVGCGSSTTPAADGAFSVSFTPGNSGTCFTNSNFVENIGSVTESVKTTLNNGAADTADSTSPTVNISCSVHGTSSFAVTGKIETVAQLLSVNIPSISTAATPTNPVTGTVDFESAAHTADNAFSGTACDFYFKPGSPESVASGKIWAAFKCDSISESGGGGMVSCALAESFFVLENCGM